MSTGVLDHFPVLQALNLSFNQITSITCFDELPSNHTALTVLDLSYNSLITLSTDVLEQFSVLKTLNLSSNQLSALTLKGDQIETNNTALQNLNLSNNLFTSIPIAELVKFQALEIVDLSFNQMSNLKSIGPEIEIAQLRELNLRLINDVMLLMRNKRKKLESN